MKYNSWRLKREFANNSSINEGSTITQAKLSIQVYKFSEMTLIFWYLIFFFSNFQKSGPKQVRIFDLLGTYEAVPWIKHDGKTRRNVQTLEAAPMISIYWYRPGEIEISLSYSSRDPIGSAIHSSIWSWFTVK